MTNAVPLAVRVVGIVRGRDIDATGTVTLDHDAVVLEWPQAAAWRLALDGIEGVGVEAQRLTVYLRDHDVLELTGGDALRPFALTIVDRACLMPELTRGLRHFGAPPRAAGPRDDAATARVRDTWQSAHDDWFGPLLAARRAVHGVSDPLGQVSLMDAAALHDGMMAALVHIAQRLAPTDPAERRAVEAALEEEAHPVFAALTRLGMAGTVVHHGAPDTRFADWRRWVAAAHGVFAAADEAWIAVEEIVRDH